MSEKATSENATESILSDDAQGDGLNADQATNDQSESPDAAEDTFNREYVEGLRSEAAGHRTRARDAEARSEELAGSLFTERVRALGILADPTDLPYDEALLDDAEGLAGALDDLVTRKPHLRARKITGDAGQGARAADGFSLSDLIRSKA